MNRRPAKAKTSVCWFAPLQLLRTAQQVAIATVFGQNADARVIEALARPLAGTTLGPGTLAKTAEDARRTPGIHDYSGKHTPFWIDYIAETGDGWDATYTVAYYASQPTLPLDRGEAAQGAPLLSTRRGDILILGGDEVYPFANYENYERRLVLPYSCAFPPDEAGSHDSPEVFAIPGNHDWYDSLVSFSRLFCSKQSFAGWRTPQTRSYFALKLPGSWWLLGTDVQLGSEIDGPQREFFEAVAEGMTPKDKVIVCHAEPHWLYETIYPVAALLVAWAAAVATQGAIGAESIWQPLATITLTALGGYFVGPLILSLYLMISLVAFRRHRNDVSSALRSPDFKNFMRLTIDENGTLTIFPIGISKAATKWTAVTGGGSKLMPQNGTGPILIEEPVSFPPSLRAADR